jgi:hypothetical protein
MAPFRVGYRDFTDDTRRAIFQDDVGQLVLGDDTERVYGIWLRDDQREQHANSSEASGN